MKAVQIAEGVAASMWPALVFAFAACAIPGVIVWWQCRQSDPERTPPWVTVWFAGLLVVVMVATLAEYVHRSRGRHRKPSRRAAFSPGS